MEIGFRVMLKWSCIIIPEALTIKCYTRYPTPTPIPLVNSGLRCKNCILCIQFAVDYSVSVCEQSPGKKNIYTFTRCYTRLSSKRQVHMQVRPCYIMHHYFTSNRSFHGSMSPLNTTICKLERSLSIVL